MFILYLEMLNKVEQNSFVRDIFRQQHFSLAFPIARKTKHTHTNTNDENERALAIQCVMHAKYSIQLANLSFGEAKLLKFSAHLTKGDNLLLSLEPSHARLYGWRLSFTQTLPCSATQNSMSADAFNLVLCGGTVNLMRIFVYRLYMCFSPVENRILFSVFLFENIFNILPRKKTAQKR